MRAITVVFGKHGVPNTGFADRVTHAPSTHADRWQHEKPHNLKLTSTHKVKPAEPTYQPHTTDENEYVVHKIIPHIGQGHNITFVVR